MDHWPDIDRCRKLDAAGFPGDCFFSWKVEIDRENFFVETSALNTADVVSLCAAPIVTELLAEILKIAPKHPRVKNMIDMIMCDDGTFMAGCFEKPMYSADVLLNALADLWLWLKGREALQDESGRLEAWPP